MSKTNPTAAAMRCARKLEHVEQPGAFYGLGGLAEVIDHETQLPQLRTAFKELLNYVGGWDVTDPAHPIVKARNALKRI